MSEMYEAAIALYLTRGGGVFISKQHIDDWNQDTRDGGSVPDIVALDFACREIVVVEVTTAANWRPLVEKLEDREANWYLPITRKLKAVGAITAEWKIRFLGFIREEFVTIAQAAFPSDPDVTFASIEHATYTWDYSEHRSRKPLPGNGRTIGLPVTH